MGSEAFCWRWRIGEIWGSRTPFQALNSNVVFPPSLIYSASVQSLFSSSSTSSQFTSFSSQSQPIHPCHLPSPPCPSLFNTAWLHSLQQKFSCPAFPKLLLCFSFSSSHKLLVPSFPLYLSLGISVLVRPVPAPWSELPVSHHFPALSSLGNF